MPQNRLATGLVVDMRARDTVSVQGAEVTSDCRTESRNANAEAGAQGEATRHLLTGASAGEIPLSGLKYSSKDVKIPHDSVILGARGT